jgi:hypothetical protein
VIVGSTVTDEGGPAGDEVADDAQLDLVTPDDDAALRPGKKITGSSSGVELTNGASSRNVSSQVGRSATLGEGSELLGTVMALTALTAGTGATVRVAVRTLPESTTTPSVAPATSVVGGGPGPPAPGPTLPGAP